MRSARERALGGAQVHLGLARPRDAVEQEVASALREQRLDLPDRGRLGLCQRLRARRAARRDARNPQTGIERDEAVLRQATDGGGSRASPLDELGERQRARREELEQRASPRRRRRHARRRDPRVARRAHARWQRQRQRPGGGRAVVGRDPEAQLQHDRGDAGLVGESLDARAARPRAALDRRPRRRRPRTVRPASGTCTTSPRASSTPSGAR